jgi:hypothetical protein
MERETFSGFVMAAAVLLADKWPVVGLSFDGIELWLVRGKLESLAR